MAVSRNKYCGLVQCHSHPMVPKHHKKADVVCEDCPFSATIHDGDDRLPADVVREHGKETGHKLSVEFPGK